MRTRVGNPFNEAHMQNMRCIDWFAPAGTNPNAIPGLIETAIPTLKLYHRGDLEVNGYINTSLRPGGLLYISVQLYDVPCSDPACVAAHGTVKILVAPAVTPAQLAAIGVAVGEAVGAVLTEVNAQGMLAAHGFQPNDPPRRGP